MKPGRSLNENTSSSAGRILDDLRARIKLGEWTPGTRLPSVRQLAREYHASTATIQAVLNSLGAKGNVETQGATRKRYYVPGDVAGSAASVVIKKSRSRSAPILRALREDVLSGDVLDNERKLLPNKILVERYGTTAETLLSVQRRLADEGLTRRYGRRWVSNEASFSQSEMLFNLVLRPGQFAPATKPFESVFGSLEYELQQAGLENRRPIVAYSPDSSSLQPMLRSSAAFFHCHSADIDSWMNFYAGIGNIPVIYVNIAPSELNRPLPAHHVLIHTDEHAAGRAVGQYLARRGHSRIAFLFPETLKDERWLRERIEGLGEFYEPSSETPGKRQMDLYSLRPSDGEFEIETSMLQRLGRIMNTYYPREVRSHFLRPLWETRNTIPTAKDLLERLKCLYKDKSVTAWVFANDRLAFTGAGFLADISRRREKPELIGFDNSPVSAQLGLTSYDFGIPRLCRLSVQSFLRPVDMRRTYGRRIALKGTLMVRNSG